MERNYNSVAFSPEEVEKGLHMDLIKYLTNYNAARETTDYYEIHITSDGFCMVVEFEKVPYMHDYGGVFEYVDCDQAVLTQRELSDGTLGWFTCEEEYQEAEAQLKEKDKLDNSFINCIYTDENKPLDDEERLKIFGDYYKTMASKDENSNWKKVTDEDVIEACKRANRQDILDAEQEHSLDFED